MRTETLNERCGVCCAPKGDGASFGWLACFPLPNGPLREGRSPGLLSAPCYTHPNALRAGMSGDEHPSMTKTHWRDAAPPLFTKEQLESSSGTATSLDMATLLALFAFVGVVVPQRPRALEC